MDGLSTPLRIWTVGAAACLLLAAASATDDSDGLVVFAGYEAPRYQQHDALIIRLVKHFNADKVAYAGADEKQAADIPDLSPVLVKAWIIQESGGGDARSRAAWEMDPAQVNVPGDWSDVKEHVGLARPSKRNTPTLENNLRAAIMFLARKGFGRSGQPASRRPDGYFDSWATALERYNGRIVICTNDRPYCDNYARRILVRMNDPDRHAPIELPRPVR